jgi:type IV secretion system protein VirB8
MKKAEREALDAYYVEAGSWATSNNDTMRRSKRTAWIIAGVATAIALFEAAAIIAIMPLKTVVPYTLLVDRTTGYVQELQPLEADRIAPDAALTQSFLVQYVVARESFDIDALQSNYRKISLWSTGTARNDYVSAVQASNPDSPLARYPRTTTVNTRVKSVTALDNKSALVRFETTRRDAGGQPGAARNWVAVIRYSFSQQPLQTEDRFINPLGFQVERYQRNQETLSPAEPDAPPSDEPAPVGEGAAPATGPGISSAPISQQNPGRGKQVVFGSAQFDAGNDWVPRKGADQ